tara:strand:- start:499 stop:987 length:489 start_codon:yes stop_codon:yes gene_type:complete
MSKLIVKDMTKERENSFIGKLMNLPEEICIIYILPYLHAETLVWLNKENYVKYHYVISKLISYKRNARFPNSIYDSYIRSLIGNDYSFVFCQVLKDNIVKWTKIREYHYRNKKYSTYLHFLWDLAIDKNSDRCRNLINSEAKSIIGEKWYKNTKTTKSKWRN